MIEITDKSGLILEGGGMRGAFTCGVLDCFMDNDIRFPYTIGVSAGACHGLSYISRQKGRAKFSSIDMLEKYHYISMKHFITHRNIMDFDLMFHTFPEELIPYDYEMLAKTEQRFEMVTTSCKTGKACYYEEKNNPERVIDIVRASSSLPFVCPIAYVDGEPMLDGGLSDSIPIMRARELGYDNNVVVLTRNRGHRNPDKDMRIASLFYKEYPAVQETLRNRNRTYNKQLSLIEKMEDAGEIVVIRPQKPIEVDRMERDTKKLMALYDEGYEIARSVLE